MPLIFETTNLWTKTLASQSGEDHSSAARERLRSSFLRFRHRVALLAAEIHTNLPDYTVHDITHLDALWEMAAIIAGDEYKLTPTEAYVLGGAILVHDLGMGLASYPHGIEELKKELAWKDIVTSLTQKDLNRLPTEAELSDPPKNIERAAIAEMLRTLHAQQAEKLGLISWRAKEDDPPQFLIEDNELRQAFGRTIGLIGHSHWWPVSRLEREFSRSVGAPPWCPKEWIVDPLKIACLLRVADAGHIDSRRAPSFLRALRKPTSYSDEHWKFQERLQKPYATTDALAYTSGSAFPLQDAIAWWICLDTLSMIDRELRQVDSLLADKGMQRFEVRRVAGIDSPERLVSYIPTEGWFPVNAPIQVSDVPKLVKNLGGSELYGHDLSAPLRELIQNASDAIRVRRFVESRESTWGKIQISIGADAEGEYLEVEDNGIGMSSELLTKYLLDFGSSYWGSRLMIDEFPGLLSAGIKLTGKYGIGFYSVFMLGDAVRIRTRRADAAQDQTLVLEFNTGLSARPIIRPAAVNERIRDGGTSVRVWLSIPSKAEGGFLHLSAPERVHTLEELCKKVCLTLDVDLEIREAGVATHSIRANEWLSTSNEEFFQQIAYMSSAPYPFVRDQYIHHIPNIRFIKNGDGEIVGRAAISVPYVGLGGVSVGGLYSCGLDGMLGILVGKSERAARDQARPIASLKAISDWATEQAALAPNIYTELEDLMECASTVKTCGGDASNLPLAFYQGQWLTIKEFEERNDLPEELIIMESYHIQDLKNLSGFELMPNVILTNTVADFAMVGYGRYGSWPGTLYREEEEIEVYINKSLIGTLIKAIASVWQVTVESLYTSFITQEEKNLEQPIIAHIGKEPIREHVSILKKPK